MKCPFCDGYTENNTCPNCGPIDFGPRRKTPRPSLEGHPNKNELRALLRSQNRDLAIDGYHSIPNQKRSKNSRRNAANARLIPIF